MEELDVLAPGAGAGRTRVGVDQRTEERLGFVMGAPIGRVCHIDIGSLGLPLSRSKDLSCLGHSDR